MRDLVVLFIHFIATLAGLLGPGGARSIVAESLLLKQELLIVDRSRHRSPNLSASDRILACLMALVVRPTGKSRRTPVGDGLIGNQFWLVAEHGIKADTSATWSVIRM